MGDSLSKILIFVIPVVFVVLVVIYGFYVWIFNKKEKTNQDWSDGDTDYNDYEEDTKLINKTKGQVKKYR